MVGLTRHGFSRNGRTAERNSDANPGTRVGSAQKGVFRKDGEYWTVGYGNSAFRLKDTKGFSFLTHLSPARPARRSRGFRDDADGSRRSRYREKAQTLLSEALETCTHIGMPRHIEIAKTLMRLAV